MFLKDKPRFDCRTRRNPPPARRYDVLIVSYRLLVLTRDGNSTIIVCRHVSRIKSDRAGGTSNLHSSVRNYNFDDFRAEIIVKHRSKRRRAVTRHTEITVNRAVQYPRGDGVDACTRSTCAVHAFGVKGGFDPGTVPTKKNKRVPLFSRPCV